MGSVLDAPGEQQPPAGASLTLCSNSEHISHAHLITWFSEWCGQLICSYKCCGSSEPCRPSGHTGHHARVSVPSRTSTVTMTGGTSSISKPLQDRDPPLKPLQIHPNTRMVSAVPGQLCGMVSGSTNTQLRPGFPRSLQGPLAASMLSANMFLCGCTRIWLPPWA